MDKDIYRIRQNTLNEIQKINDKIDRLRDEAKDKAQKLYLIDKEIQRTK